LDEDDDDIARHSRLSSPARRTDAPSPAAARTPVYYRNLDESRRLGGELMQPAVPVPRSALQAFVVHSRVMDLGTCKQCVAGKYSFGGKDQCAPTSSNCPPGQDTPAGASDPHPACVTCDPGRFSPGADTPCADMKCLPGQSSNRTGSRTNVEGCKSCVAGFYSTGGSFQCAPQQCPAGCYSIGGASVPNDPNVCISCPQGKFSPGGSSIVCTDTTCTDPGDFTPINSDVCEPCPEGTFNTGSEQCTPTQCGDGEESPKTGATSPVSFCVACGVGRSATDGSSYNETCACVQENKCQDCETGKFAPEEKQDFCQRCPLGKFSTLASASFDCKMCTAGQISTLPFPTNTCFACEGGQFAVSGDTNCTKCAAGTASTNDPPTDVCGACGAGKFALKGSTVCSECVAGQHSNLPVNGSCTACDAGKFANTTGQGACYGCSAGFVSNAERTICDACPAGKFEEKLNTECTECPLGQFEGTGGVAQCQACDDGSVSFENRTGCVLCAAGQAEDTATFACKPCPAGQYSAKPGLTACTSCDAGYVSEAGQVVCLACDKGKFAVPPSTCTVCDAGQFAGEVAQTQCNNCPAGKYSNEDFGTSACGDAACVPGKTAPEASKDATTDCTDCPQGKFCVGDASLPVAFACKAGSGAPPGPGATNPDPRALPFPASAGTQCNPCSAGWWADATGDMICELTNCGPGTGGPPASQTATKCAACLAGQFSAKIGDNCSASACTPGSASALSRAETPTEGCAVCDAGRYSAGGGQDGCQPTVCDAGTAAGKNATSPKDDCLECEAGKFSPGGYTQCTVHSTPSGGGRRHPMTIWLGISGALAVLLLGLLVRLCTLRPVPNKHGGMYHPLVDPASGGNEPPPLPFIQVHAGEAFHTSGGTSIITGITSGITVPHAAPPLAETREAVDLDPTAKNQVAREWATGMPSVGSVGGDNKEALLAGSADAQEGYRLGAATDMIATASSGGNASATTAIAATAAAATTSTASTSSTASPTGEVRPELAAEAGVGDRNESSGSEQGEEEEGGEQIMCRGAFASAQPLIVKITYYRAPAVDSCLSYSTWRE
jgi:hypothetical protein